jgi:hypothetical protein
MHPCCVDKRNPFLAFSGEAIDVANLMSVIFTQLLCPLSGVCPPPQTCTSLHCDAQAAIAKSLKQEAAAVGALHQ